MLTLQNVGGSINMDWLDEVNSEYWRQELIRILTKQEPIDTERLFLVSFLYDRLQWSPMDIFTFIDLYNHWSDYQSAITKRQVFRICEKKKFSKYDLENGYENETQLKNVNCVDVTPTHSVGGFGEFHFFNEKEGGEEIADIDIEATFKKVNNGHKYFQFVEKVWHKGNDPIHFLSLESGEILKSDDGNIFYARPTKFLTLPTNKDLIHELGQALLDYPYKETAEVSEVKKKK